MTKAGIRWFDDLRRFIRECRKQKPLMERSTLSHVEEIQCRIIGGSLIGWLDDYGPRLIQERAIMAGVENWEKDPYVVFTSEQSGLVAASEILGNSSPSVVFLFQDEFDQWLTKNPDNDFLWHVHTWSLFVTLNPDIAQKASRYPLLPNESYWLHKEGTQCGPLFGRGGDHLWKWDGKEPTLLEEGINQWIT